MEYYMKLNEKIKKQEDYCLALNKSLNEAGLEYVWDYTPCVISKTIKITLKYNQKNRVRYNNF